MQDQVVNNSLEFAKRDVSSFFTRHLINIPESTAHEFILIEGEFDAGASSSKAISNFFLRFRMVIFAAFALLAPMLIMTLNPTKLTVLLTTIFVLVVAGILAASMTTANGNDVVVATTAYAAVLVVFVGSANAGGSQGEAVIGGIVAGAAVGLTLLIAVLVRTALCFDALGLCMLSGSRMRMMKLLRFEVQQYKLDWFEEKSTEKYCLQCVFAFFRSDLE
jgi:hypothetical protein